MEHYSYQELTEGIKKRDEPILRYIIERCKPAVVLMIKKMGGNEEDANDIFHDALLEIIEKVDNQSFVISTDIQNILHMICSNKQKNKIKRSIPANNYLSSLIRNYEYLIIDPEKENNLYKEALRAALQKLSDLCKNIIILQLKGVRVIEMSDYLDYSYNYIRTKHPQCVDSLREYARTYAESKE